jgi:hypothetical protein
MPRHEGIQRSTTERNSKYNASVEGSAEIA